MNIRFYNVRILPMTDKSMKIFEGELWVKDSVIVYVGPDRKSAGAMGKADEQTEESGTDGTTILQSAYPEKEYQETVWDREIDGKGNLLMPGFKNAHTHSAMTFLRSLADDLPLQEWLNEQVFPREAKLTGDDVYWLSKLAFLEYLTSGITACFDMYYERPYFVQAAKETGFRSVLCGAINDFGGTAESMEEDYVQFNQEGPLISFELGFHAEYTTSPSLLKDIVALSHKLKAPVYTHNSETAREVEECVQRYGVSPTVYLDSLGMFDYGGGGFHCVHVSEADMDIFKKRNLWVVTNPGSNMKLASGIAPVERMLDAGIGLAIGTDGPASNNCLDMWKEMSLTTGLQKLKNKDSAAMPAEDVLMMATVGGAKAMCLENCVSLTPGSFADLIMVDLHRPNMQPVHNIVKNLVYSGSKENVALTMIHGRILYENYQFYVNEDPEKIYCECSRIAKRICE